MKYQLTKINIDFMQSKNKENHKNIYNFVNLYIIICINWKKILYIFRTENIHRIFILYPFNKKYNIYLIIVILLL